MRQERRVVRSISTTDGLLTDKSGASVTVRFSLTQWQNYIDDVPSLRSAAGSIEFKDTSQAWAAMNGEVKTLTGGGIRANVNVITINTFQVTGPVNDI